MDLQTELKKISTLREIKGKEQETLAEIDKLEIEATNQNNVEILTKLNWERSLVFQHIVMNEEAKSSPDQKIIAEAIQKMENATLEADKIIIVENLTDLKPMSYRFLAQVFRYKKDYVKAALAYQAAIGEYEKTQEVNRLELKGFLAAVLILQNKTQEGTNLAIKTFNDFDTDPKATELKRKDYVTWAIWKSGIFPRLVRALAETGVTYDKKLISDYLNKSEEILKNPQGPITWGDSKFSFRMGEVAKARSLLTIIIGFVFNFVSIAINTFKSR